MDRAHLLEYTHLDWAWCFTRHWHEARYERLFDEALAQATEDDSFRFFVDSLCESLVPYLAGSPDRQWAVAELLATGQLAFVGGQYANLRPATAPEELYLRNLEEGMAVLREWFPTVVPLGYANLDTAIGHSQLPQVLALAGFRYLLAGRPELGLELDRVPKLFRWQGAGGSEILVLVQHYGILEGGLRQMASAGPARQEAGAARCRELLAAHRAVLPEVQWAFLAADDMRFRRDHVSDEPIAVERLQEAWREAFGAELVSSTPDELYAELAEHLARLPVRQGPVDHADVGYNGPFGPNGLRGLRDAATAALQAAERSAALLLPGEEWPGDELQRLWRLALRAQTHATQYLFAEDVAGLRLDLELVIREATAIAGRGYDQVAAAAAPHRTRTMAVFNPHPRPVRRTVSLPILRTDFTVGGYRVEGEVPQQVVASPNPGRPGEWELLAELDLPACGLRSVRLEATERTAVPGPNELPLTGTCQLGPLELHWEDGLLVTMEQGRDKLLGTSTTSLLEPVRRPATVQSWMTTALAAPEPRCVVTRLRQTEFGPLRWAVEREARLGEHRVWQRFVTGSEGELAVTTEVDYGVDTCMFTLALPCPDGAALRVSIPFGVEERDLSGTHYSPGGGGDRVIERLLPGMLYARDWARFAVAGTPVALLVLDGDRYWLRRDGEGRLEHLLARACEPARDGWVSRTVLAGAGRVQARHVLWLGQSAADEPLLDERVDEARQPVVARYAETVERDGVPLLTVWPRHVRVLAVRRVGEEIEVKLVENGDEGTAATVTFAWPVARARLVDLRGRVLSDPLPKRGCRVTVPLDDRQIRILRVTHSTLG